MTQEDKELFLKDLCSRLPYGVFVKEKNRSTPIKCDLECHPNLDDLENVKLYLRPMSSMTEEEKKEYRKTQINKWIKCVDCTGGGYYEHRDTLITFDWLNAHHFDYRELIKKGLAIAVTEDNNPYKE